MNKGYYELLTTTVLSRKDNNCWTWPGTHNNSGYPTITVLGRSMGAYIASYELRYGKIPTGLEADHICINRWCWNPDHIEPVTHSENHLRSGNQHTRKTHCINGHPLTEGNLQKGSYIIRNPRRICLECKRNRTSAYKHCVTISRGI